MDNYDETVRGVRVVRWNPARPVSEGSELARVNNFGDLLGPIIVERLSRSLPEPLDPHDVPKLLAVGSILQFAAPGDVIWGAGVNGKVPLSQVSATPLDVRAVRGPLTRSTLQSLGHTVPETYGDPALLLPIVMPEIAGWTRCKSRAITVIPNFNDLDAFDEGDPRVISPQGELWSVVRAIAESEFVVGSSLHAIIVAEALGVPARPCLSAHETEFKYVDYFAGTGRTGVRLAATVDEALAMGSVAELNWQPDRLVASFPEDLWTGYQPAERERA